MRPLYFGASIVQRGGPFINQVPFLIPREKMRMACQQYVTNMSGQTLIHVCSKHDSPVHKWMPRSVGGSPVPAPAPQRGQHANNILLTANPEDKAGLAVFPRLPKS